MALLFSQATNLARRQSYYPGQIRSLPFSPVSRLLENILDVQFSVWAQSHS
jgi:hypothetical protein